MIINLIEMRAKCNELPIFARSVCRKLLPLLLSSLTQPVIFLFCYILRQHTNWRKERTQAEKFAGISSEQTRESVNLLPSPLTSPLLFPPRVSFANL